MLGTDVLYIQSQEILAEAGADLKNLGIGIYHKEVQEVETVSEHVLLGAQMSMRVEDVETKFAKPLKNQERRELQGTMGSVFCDHQRFCSRDAVGIRQR